MNGQENSLVYADRRNEVVSDSPGFLQDIVSNLARCQQAVGDGVFRPAEGDRVRRYTRRDFCRSPKGQPTRNFSGHCATSDPEYAMRHQSGKDDPLTGCRTQSQSPRSIVLPILL
jgi:hypothetical protein